jgi:FAD/FMN-containing dehydrogenase
MPRTWENWAGSVQFEPRTIVEPSSEKEVVEAVRRAADEGMTVRVAGSGHSSSALVRTPGMLVDLHQIGELESHGMNGERATLGAGAKLDDVNALLFAEGLMMENLGDVAYQALAGAVATGTHGSGRRLTNLSGMVEGGRMVTGTGELIEFSGDDGDLLRAARVSLGCLGILTAVTIRTLPAYRLHRQEWCASTEACLEHLDEMMDANRNFDFYWYPRRDEVKLRTWNHPEERPDEPAFATLVKEMRGWAKDVLATEQPLRFHEMEYGLPLGGGADCFRAIRERVRSRHRKHVAWRILCRPIAADDAFLSNCSGRETLAITVHQNSTLPYREYFEDLEPIFREHGGRPHWGKRHTMDRCPDRLKSLYPAWDRFMKVRRELDPAGIFMSEYMRRLFGFDGGGRDAQAS